MIVDFPSREPEAPTFLSMEHDVCNAANAATALCMAIGGMGKMPLDEGEEQAALSWLSHEASFAAEKIRALWYEIAEADRPA